jgi:hypothetical protein
MKKLSIISCARNDHYNGNFAYRLRMSVYSLWHCLEKLGCVSEVEWIICDWNSTPESIDALFAGQPPAKAEFLRVLDVTEASLTEHGLPLDLNAGLAFNLGLRQAEGEFILGTDSDAFYILPQVDILWRLLSGAYQEFYPDPHTYFAIERSEVPFSLVQGSPSYEELCRLIAVYGGRFRLCADPFCFGGYQGMLARRSAWEEMGGLSERYRGWGMNDTDYVVRHGSRYPVVNTNGIGLRFYHLGHRDPNKPHTGPQATALNFVPQLKAMGEAWGSLGSTPLAKRARADASKLNKNTSGLCTF